MLLAIRPILTLPPTAPRPKRVEMEVQVVAPRLRKEPRPQPLPVDFNFVPLSQQELHERLLDWARAARNPQVQQVSAGFDRAQSSYVRDVQSYGAPTTVPVDQMDTQRIAAAVALLAQDTRRDGFRRAAALNWYYIDKCHDAKGKAEELCLSKHGLAECVIAARDVLIERGV